MKPDLQHVGDDCVTGQTPHEVVHCSAVEPRRLAHVHPLEEGLDAHQGRPAPGCRKWDGGAIPDIERRGRVRR